MALEAKTGNLIWRFEVDRRLDANGHIDGAQSRVAANVWSSPAIDPRLRLVFFGTADGDPSDRQLATNGVETDIAGFERHSQRPAGTAQQRCDPCNQLGHRVGAAGD